MADEVFAAALANAKENLPKIADELDPNKYGIVLSVSGPGKYTPSLFNLNFMVHCDINFIKYFFSIIVVIAERMSGAAMYELVG